MAMKLGSVNQWRNYFRSANSDIFEIIDHAIVVAASDCPKEFRLRRDGIAEKLFSCMLPRCLGCDRVELQDNNNNDDDGCKSGFDGVEFEAGASKESKVNCSRDENEIENENENEEEEEDDHDNHRNPVSNYSFGEAEALTDEIEEQSQYLAEVLRIKDILFNRQEQSESVLYESLRRLQLMELSVDLLKATEIGKAVNPLRKHGSKDLRQLARTLIDGWKEMVDEWVKATTTTTIAASEGTPDSVNPSVVDDDEEEEEGLPSPPLDEGAFFVAPTGSIELSQFFDGMDDDGNPRQYGQFNRNRGNGRRPALNNQITDRRKPQASDVTTMTAKDNTNQQAKKNEAAVAAVRLNKPVTADSGPGRPPKSNTQRKGNVESNMQQKVENRTITRRPLTGQQDKSKCSDDAAVQVKLEATKRKLQERYQQVENAKRQRTIQVMEINDIPKTKQGIAHRNPHFKPGNHNRQWGHGRR